MTQIQRNRTSQKDFFTLAKYIEENKANLEGKSKPEVARIVSNAMGVVFSESTVSTAAEAAGVEIGRKNNIDHGDEKAKTLAQIVLRIIKELEMEPSITPSQMSSLLLMCGAEKS